MHGQQLSKRFLKKHLNLQQNNSLFLRLKAEAVQFLNQIDLYRSHHHNYNMMMQRLSSQLSNCTSQQQGELCLLLCQTGINMNLSLVQMPLPQNFAQLVIYYINNLLQKKGDLSTIQNHTRQVYEGKFKIIKQKKQFLENQQKLRDLLLVQRIDKVLALAVDYLRQRQSKYKLSQRVIDYVSHTKDLAYRYLGIEEYQKYQRNLQTITFNNPKSIILRKAVTTPIYRNFVIIGQKDTDFRDTEIDKRECSIKQKSLKRTSSKLHLLQRNSSYDSIHSSNSIQVQQQKRTVKGSQRLKGSLKRSDSSLTKRGSVEVKKSPEYLVRKSIHFANKQMFDFKPGATKNQRKSRFQVISKSDINNLAGYPLINRYENELNESISVYVSKKQAFKMPSFMDQQIFSKKIKEIYIFLQEKKRIWSLILKPNIIHYQGKSHQDILGGQKQFQLLLEGYLVFDCSRQHYSQQDNVCQLYYLQKLCNSLGPYRNCRNELVFSNKLLQLQRGENRRKNVFQVSKSKQILLMGFIRKLSTHFIVQCFFDRKLIQNCYEPGVKSRLLTPNLKLSFQIVYSYKLMNQDLFMTYKFNQNMCSNKGSFLQSIQNRDNNQIINQTSEQKYKIAITQFIVKESDQEIDFITIWKRKTETMYYDIPKIKRKQTLSGTEIITKQKVNTVGSDNKRIKRIPHNKSSIRLHQGDVQKILQNNFSVGISSKTKTCSKKQVVCSEKIVPGWRTIKKEKRNKKRLDIGKQLIESICTQKGYKFVRRSIVENSNGITYSQYYGYLQRRANLIEYHRNQSTSFSKFNQNKYLKSRMTIHGKKTKVQSNNTKLLTFIKRLKNDTSLFGYLVGSIKLLRKDKNRYVYMEVYWQCMQKYFVFILSQEIFQKMTQIKLDQFENHQFSTSIEKLSKKRQKKTSVMSSLMCHREKQAISLKKCDESRINTLRVPKVLSIQRDNYQSHSKTQTSKKLKETAKNLSSNLRTNNFFRSEKTSESFSFNSFENMKLTQRLHFKKQVANYIRNKLIRYTQFSWKNYNLILELRHPNLEEYVKIYGKELAVKNIHYFKNKHLPTSSKQSQKSEVSATQLLIVKYYQSNLANLTFYTYQGLSKIYLEHLFIKNSDDLFGCYKNNICLGQISDNRERIDVFYSCQNRFFQQGSKDQNLLSVSQPVLRHFISKQSNKDQQKRYKYAQIIKYAKKCGLSFDFIEKKRKKILKNLFVIRNRYPHLNLKHFMLSAQMTFESIQITDLNGSTLLSFQKQKMLNYFPYLYKLSKLELKKLLVQRLLKDPDLISLCQSHQNNIY